MSTNQIIINLNSSIVHWITKQQGCFIYKKTYTEAHISMALDSIPLIFCGFRLHKNTPSLSCKSSMGTSPASPLTTVLSSPLPKSTVSTYSESASGCCNLKIKLFKKCLESSKEERYVWPLIIIYCTCRFIYFHGYQFLRIEENFNFSWILDFGILPTFAYIAYRKCIIRWPFEYVAHLYPQNPQYWYPT